MKGVSEGTIVTWKMCDEYMDMAMDMYGPWSFCLTIDYVRRESVSPLRKTPEAWIGKEALSGRERERDLCIRSLFWV